MSEELFDIVDENDNLLGIQKPRSIVHKEMKDYHRVTAVWIINENNEALCQKRSLMAEANAGKWQSYFSGHVKAGKSYEQSASDELNEELGLKLNPSDLKFAGDRKSDEYKHLVKVYIFYCKKEQKFILQKEEVEEAKWIDLPTLEKMFKDGAFCNRPNEKMLQFLRGKITI